MRALRRAVRIPGHLWAGCALFALAIGHGWRKTGITPGDDAP